MVEPIIGNKNIYPDSIVSENILYFLQNPSDGKIFYQRSKPKDGFLHPSEGLKQLSLDINKRLFKEEISKIIIIIFGNWGTGKSSLALGIGKVGIGGVEPNEIISIPYDCNERDSILKEIQAGKLPRFGERLMVITTVNPPDNLSQDLINSIILVEIDCDDFTRMYNLMMREFDAKNQKPISVLTAYKKAQDCLIKSTPANIFHRRQLTANYHIDMSFNLRFKLEELPQLLKG